MEVKSRRHVLFPWAVVSRVRSRRQHRNANVAGTQFRSIEHATVRLF